MNTEIHENWGVGKPRSEMTPMELWEKYKEIEGEEDPVRFSLTYMPADFWDLIDLEQYYHINTENITPDRAKEIYFQMVAHIDTYAPQTAVVIRGLWYNHSLHGQRIVFLWQAIMEIQQRLNLPAARPAKSTVELEREGRKRKREDEKAAKAGQAAVVKAQRSAAWNDRQEMFGRRRNAIANAGLAYNEARANMNKALAEAQANFENYKQSWKAYCAGLKAEVERLKALPMEDWEE